LRPFAILLVCGPGHAAPAADADPAIVAVAEGGSCPSGVAVRDAIAHLVEVTGRPAAVVGAEGEFVLSVIGAEPAANAMQITLRAQDGREAMTRDLAVAGSSCAGRARSIAVVVQRYLEALSVPPAGMRRSSDPMPLPPPTVSRPPPDAPTRIEARAGWSRDAQLGAATDNGVAIAVVVQPLSWMEAQLGGRMHVPRSEAAGTGEVHASRHEVHLAVATGLRLGRARVEGGAGGRIDFVRVETQGLAQNGRSTRTSPAALLFAGVSTPVFRQLAVFLTIEYYRRYREHSFLVEGVAEPVERTSGTGLALTAGLGYRIW